MFGAQAGLDTTAHWYTQFHNAVKKQDFQLVMHVMDSCTAANVSPYHLLLDAVWDGHVASIVYLVYVYRFNFYLMRPVDALCLRRALDRAVRAKHDAVVEFMRAHTPLRDPRWQGVREPVYE